jgi:methylase of polypeptide subunit release factors
MLNEIVRARQNITTYMDITQKIRDPKGASLEIRYRRVNERSARQLKYDTIRNCIFAVDIEPSAVDIAQLRLWLALVIDDEIDPNAMTALDGHRNPLPLPNLECNILCGNSLIDEFEGIKLINESDLIGTADATMQFNVYQNAFDTSLERLISKQEELFRCDNTDKKAMLSQEISDLRDAVIMSQLKGTATPEQIARYQATKQMASKPFVLWQLDFAKVFREKGGFDIVIGNPPYLESRSPNFSNELKDELQRVIKRRYGANAGWFSRGCDLLIYFYELSLRLINKGGINTFITQNSWLDTEYGMKFQEFLLKTTNILAIIDSDFKYFETAEVNTIITFLKGNTGCSSPLLFARCHKNLKYYSLPANSHTSIDNDAVSYKILSHNDKLLSEMKWGFIFITDEKLLSIIEKVSKYGKRIEQTQQFSVGQGLNLRKSFVISSTLANTMGINKDDLIPYFVTEESGVYSWDKCTHYLAPKSNSVKLSILNAYNDVELFDDLATTKRPPVLIMPRGIGARHFCCYNAINGYSSSCVDVYSNNGNELTDDVLRLWIYFNSSLCWLIREFAGRKNLGGGMLKAEAVDLQPFASYFNFPDIDKCQKLFRNSRDQMISNAQIEVNTELHRAIDKIVFDFVELDFQDREYIVNMLTKKVDSRYKKTTAK